MKRLLALIILMFLSLPVVGVSSVFVSGSKLLAECEDTDNDLSQAYCIGYIQGVHDASGGKNWQGFTYCAPNELTGGATRENCYQAPK